eukprot:4566370-Pyramimonas_sp.AAC.1
MILQLSQIGMRCCATNKALEHGDDHWMDRMGTEDVADSLAIGTAEVSFGSLLENGRGTACWTLARDGATGIVREIAMHSSPRMRL